MFSIIIPIYNAEATIRDTLDSIRRQTYDGFEVMMVDDGSSDNSSEVCREYEKKDARFRYIRQDNRGVAEARNTGLKMAREGYVMFVDADDMLEDNALTVLSGYLCNDDYDVISFGWMEKQNIGSGWQEIRVVHNNMVATAADNMIIAKYLLTTGYIKDKKNLVYPDILRGTVWNSVFKKELIEKNKITFFAFWNNEDDWIFDILALKNSKKTLYITECLYLYRIDPGSLSRKKRYVEDMYQKRGNGVRWISDKIDELSEQPGVKEQEYKGILQRQLLLLTLYNETATEKHKTSHEAIKYIESAVSNERKKKINPNMMIGARIKEKIFIWLLLHHMVWAAYLINRYLTKIYR